VNTGKCRISIGKSVKPTPRRGAINRKPAPKTK
jgi:hypothetical protein